MFLGSLMRFQCSRRWWLWTIYSRILLPVTGLTHALYHALCWPTYKCKATQSYIIHAGRFTHAGLCGDQLVWPPAQLLVTSFHSLSLLGFIFHATFFHYSIMNGGNWVTQNANIYRCTFLFDYFLKHMPCFCLSYIIIPVLFKLSHQWLKIRHSYLFCLHFTFKFIIILNFIWI